MTTFTTDIETRARPDSVHYANDYDFASIVDEDIETSDAQIKHCMCSLHADGSITDWDWANEPGWDERHIYTEEELAEIRDSIDLDAIMAAHDTSNN